VWTWARGSGGTRTVNTMPNSLCSNGLHTEFEEDGCTKQEQARWKLAMSAMLVRKPAIAAMLLGSRSVTHVERGLFRGILVWPATN
jgi:hypothetical protein